MANTKNPTPFGEPPVKPAPQTPQPPQTPPPDVSNNTPSVNPPANPPVTPGAPPFVSPTAGTHPGDPSGSPANTRPGDQSNDPRPHPGDPTSFPASTRPGDASRDRPFGRDGLRPGTRPGGAAPVSRNVPFNASVASGYTRVNILSGDRCFSHSIDIPDQDFGPQITVEGVTYHHVDDAGDGTWQFCKAAK